MTFIFEAGGEVSSVSEFCGTVLRRTLGVVEVVRVGEVNQVKSDEGLSLAYIIAGRR
jgi:hypothetical protein